MQFIAAVACTLLLANVSANEAREGAPRIKIKVKELDSSRATAAVEMRLKALASVDDVMASKDGTVTILMKQGEKALTLRLSEITGAVEIAGGKMKVWEEKTIISGKCRIEVKDGAGKTVGSLLHNRKDIKSVSKGILGKGTVSFEIETRELDLGNLLAEINDQKIESDKVDIIWTSPAKKKTGGGG